MKRLFFVIAIAGFFVGCKKDTPNENTCTYDPCSFQAPSAEIQAVQKYLTDSSLTAVQHCSGLFYNIQDTGTGIRPTACSSVAVMYKGKLTNGSVFDSSSNPVAFRLSGLITSWVNGIPLIRQGGKITLYVPPSLGYGNATNGPIPANSILIFDIELLGVQL